MGQQDQDAVILGGARTPFVKAGGEFAALDVLDLAQVATKEAIARCNIPLDAVQAIIYGNVSRPVSYHNLAREIALTLSLPPAIPASTVGMACASACVALTNATDQINLGHADLILAGGVESLSNIPLMLQPKLSRALVRASAAKSFSAKLGSLAGIGLKDIAPVAPGIRETTTGMSMGEAAERMAAINEISRRAQDIWAERSHRLAGAGWDDGRLAAEVAPVFIRGKAISIDGHIRRDSSLEKMATLRTVFDKKYGSITAANSSPLTDGAATLVLASRKRAKELGRTPLATIRAYAYAAVDPADQLLIAPAYAIPIALARAGLKLSDIDLFEMHEAFAAQVLSTLRVLAKNGVGEIDENKLNVMGGSIALGHPFGATGARIMLTLAYEMKRRSVRYGLMSVCAAGGNGAAIILESVRD